MSFEIGQIIYVISTRDHRVVPVRICEQTVHRSLYKDNKVEYFVTLSDKKESDDNSKLPNLESIGTKYFVSLRDASDYLLDNARTAIDKIIGEAGVLTQQMFTQNNGPQEESLEQAQ